MIENTEQLIATLDYITKWADALEAMRLHEIEQNGGVFPTLLAGPLQEIRTNLATACAFAHTHNLLCVSEGNGHNPLSIKSEMPHSLNFGRSSQAITS